MTVSVVVLLHARVHVWVHTRINTWVHRRVQQTLARGSLHGSNHSNILNRGVSPVIVVMVLEVVVLVKLLLLMKLLLLVLLEVLVLLLLEVVVLKELRLVSNSGSGSGGGSSTTVAVQGLLHQGSGVLGSLLLPTNHGKVGLGRMVVRRVDHSQDPHLRVLLVVVVVAVKLVGLLLHLLGLVLLRRVQVGHQSVAALGSLGVRDPLSLCRVLDRCSKRPGALALEVHRLGLGRVDDNLALLLLVEHVLHVLDQIQLAREGFDDVALAVSQHQKTTVLVVNAGSGHSHRVLVLWQLLLVQLLLQVVLLVQLLLRQRVLLQVLVLQVLVLQVLLLQMLLLHLLLLLHLGSLRSTHVDPAVVLVLVVVAHDCRIGKIVGVCQSNGGSSGVVHLRLVVNLLLLQVVLVLGAKLAGGSLVGGGRPGHFWGFFDCCCWDFGGGKCGKNARASTKGSWRCWCCCC